MKAQILDSYGVDQTVHDRLQWVVLRLRAGGKEIAVGMLKADAAALAQQLMLAALQAQDLVLPS